MTRKIVFTGGGTAGHVTPNLALLESLQQDFELSYIGEKDSVEESIIKNTPVPFYGIRAGKLRRYFSWRTLIDPFKILYGIVQSYFLLKKIQPELVFSKGGFVSFPVVFAAFLRRIRIIVHESDMTPGLANKLCFPLADTICVNFEPAKKHIKQKNKVVVTGSPVRQSLLLGNKQQGLQRCGFNDQKPCLLIIGGSLGAQKINETVRENLTQLLERFQIIHLCGKGKLDERLKGVKGYYQLEYANEELADLMAACDLVISRSGANSLYEILSLHKPHVLVPLSLRVSRGDQIHNARYFEALGISSVIDEEQLDGNRLMHAVADTFESRNAIIERMEHLDIQSGTTAIVSLIKEHNDAQSTQAI